VGFCLLCLGLCSCFLEVERSMVFVGGRGFVGREEVISRFYDFLRKNSSLDEF